MLRKVITYITYPVLIAGIVLCLVGVAYAAANIDSTNKWPWGTNVGWINFNPNDSQVTVDLVSGDLDGYAWGENVGWIHFQNASPAYKVVTTWRGDLTATYQNNVAAIIKDRREEPASSGGLTIADVDFLIDSGDGIIFGHNNADFNNVPDHLTGTSADKRWARIWQLDVNDGSGTTGGNVDLTFDISEAGGQGNFSGSGTYFLLKRATGSSDNFTEVTVAGTSVSGDQLTFTVNASNLGSEFTIGATSGSATAITLSGFTLQSKQDPGWLAVPLALVALGAVGLLVLRRRKRRKSHVEET